MGELNSAPFNLPVQDPHSTPIQDPHSRSLFKIPIQNCSGSPFNLPVQDPHSKPFSFLVSGTIHDPRSTDLLVVLLFICK